MSLIRAFGLHRPGQTPCGQAVSVAEAHALMALSAQQGLSQNELATQLGLEKSTVSRLVKNMCDRGWLSQIRSDTDRRVVELGLTQAGKQAAAELAIARQRKFEQIFSNIPAGNQAAVMDALTILVEAMRKSD